MNEKTLGEFRVGINFNPSNNPLVDEIKTKAAELIDLIQEIKPRANPPRDFLDQDIYRLTTLAQDQIESAAMFAVKAATKQE